VVRRAGEDADYLVALNHREEDAVMPAQGVEQLTGAVCEGSLLVPAGEVRVVRQARQSERG
jgi:beta-galactosidase